MAEGAAAAAVVGTIVQLSAKSKEAKAQARAARSNAESKRLAALELLDRFELNTQALIVEGERLKAQQKTDFAGKGIDIGTGSALDVVEETNSLVAQQIILDKKEADFKAGQLLRGAEADVRLAGDIKKGARLEKLGIFLSGAGQVAGGFK